LSSYREFRLEFGVSAPTIFILWILLIIINSSGVLEYSFEQKHLLWTLFFLKNYPTANVAARHFACDEKTYRLWIWRVIGVFHWLLNTVHTF
jgi:hypothetical protein